MADPVRVQREESFQTSGPPATLVVGYVNPDDLARAIREGVDASLREIATLLAKANAPNWAAGAATLQTARAVTAVVETIGAWVADNALAATREPAQEPERKDFLHTAGAATCCTCGARRMAQHNIGCPLREPAQERQEAPLPAEHLRKLLEHRDAFIVANGLWEKYVASISGPERNALTPPTPTPDPLLPGLRAARKLWLTWCASNVGPESFEPVLDAEIARREGGA